ncbi:MAG: RsmB/NOP family class I SAM-dependent RNA methyltransferase, partial [Pseudomonadota bacterium]
GSKDRAAVADHVYDALRRWRSLGWGREDVARARILALAQEADALQAFDGQGHAPPPPTAQERAWLSGRAEALAEAPEGVRLDLPDDLLTDWRASLGEAAAPVALALTRRAEVDLRVNVARTTVQAARARLEEEGVETAPGPLSPDCLRILAGARRLRAAGAYLDGWVEVQDAASQAAAAFAEAQAGERALDWCAGGGGKALALAAQGARVTAHDAAPRRMRDLPARALRAGARIDVLPGAPPVGARYDLVFVDAPCSGSGAWRRNPDGKWSLAPARLARLRHAQAEALHAAARHVAPGGRLIYATCSLLDAENADQADAFAAQDAFEPGSERRLTPLDGADGFYMKRFRRNSR